MTFVGANVSLTLGHLVWDLSPLSYILYVHSYTTCIITSKTNSPFPGSEKDALGFGNGWIKAHGQVCTSVGKPCILEEYGMTSNKPSIEGSWQTTALNTSGIAGDMYWQYGDTLSTGKTSDDGYTIYYGSSDFASLITGHVKSIGSGQGKYVFGVLIVFVVLGMVTPAYLLCERYDFVLFLGQTQMIEERFKSTEIDVMETTSLSHFNIRTFAALKYPDESGEIYV